MPRYLCQLRRGSKETAADGSVIRDDWAAYEANQDSNPDYKIPQPGEIVLEYDNGVPRLKIGDGIHEFSALPYMSVDSFILPKPASVTIYPDKWEQMTDENGNLIENRYYQYVEIENATITPNSKIDLQPKPEDLVVFHDKDLAFTAVNSGDKVRICVIGQQPTQEYTIQATITEVAEHKHEIIGNTTATPNPRPDWNQTDEDKADFIKNKPDLSLYATQDWVKEYIGSVDVNIPIYSGAYEEV